MKKPKVAIDPRRELSFWATVLIFIAVRSTDLPRATCKVCIYSVSALSDFRLSNRTKKTDMSAEETRAMRAAAAKS